MNKLLIIIKELSRVTINMSVFGVSAWIAVLMTEGLIAMYPDLNFFYRICWLIGVCFLVINTLRIDWVSWLFRISEGESKNE